MSTSYELMGFNGNTSSHTGKIAAVYTMSMGPSSENCHPTVVFFYTKCGSISVGTTTLMQGRIPVVSLGVRQDFDSAREQAQSLINRGYKLNKAWM